MALTDIHDVKRQPKPAPPANGWMIFDGGQQFGPHTVEEILSFVQVGTVTSGALVWQEGLPAWLPVSAILPMPTATAGTVPNVQGGSLDSLGAYVSEQISAGTKRFTPQSAKRVDGWLSRCGPTSIVLQSVAAVWTLLVLAYLILNWQFVEPNAIPFIRAIAEHAQYQILCRSFFAWLLVTSPALIGALVTVRKR